MSSKNKQNLYKELQDRYQDYLKNPLNLNISRGIPSKDQLALSSELLDSDLSGDYIGEDGVDLRNYGGLTGISEARDLFAELIEVPSSQVIVAGNSSLQLMYAVLDYLVHHQDDPWTRDKNRKFICPVPGYDRHFDMLDYFGFEMVTVPMTETGPDMDKVEELVQSDDSIKGIFCVPKYSNPTGDTYSSQTIKRLAKMQTAADDFKILWDNAYCVHHLTDKIVEIDNIIELSAQLNQADRPIAFSSTSKMTFPGAGMAALAGSEAMINQFKTHLSKQIIGFDKLNQKRQVNFLKNKETILHHMAEHAKIMKPKFDYIIGQLRDEFSESGLVEWTEPKGGYFIHLQTQDYTASAIVEKLAAIGVILTPANATYPKMENIKDNSIRLAPSFATMKEIEDAMDAIVLCIKIASMEK